MRPFPGTAMAASLLLAACAGPTVDELKAEPVRFTATAPVPYDTMANCLATRALDDYLVTPLFDPRRGTATVTLTHRAAMTLQGEYTVRRADDGSTVEYRRRKLLVESKDDKARAAVESCSKT